MRKVIVLVSLIIVVVLSGCTKAAPATSSETLTRAVSTQPAPLAVTQTTTPKPLDSSSSTDQSTQSNDTKYYFTQAGQHPEKALIDVINSQPKRLILPSTALLTQIS